MKQYIITERDVGLASLFFQVINALNRCEKEELGIPIVYFKNQCVYYNPEGHQNKDNVWEYYFRPVNETADTLMISDKNKSEIENAYQNTEPKKLNNSRFVKLSDGNKMCCHYGDRKMGHTMIVPPHLIPEVYEDGHRENANAIINKYFKLRMYLNDKINDFFAENLANANKVLGVHIRGTDALVNNAERWRKTFDIQNYINCIRIFIDKYGDEGKVFVASDDAKLFNIVKNEFNDAIVEYDTFRQEEQDVGKSGDNTKGNAMMPTYLCEDGAKAAQNGEDAIAEMYLLSKCDYLLHNASGFAHVALLLNSKMKHVDSQRPGGKETLDKMKEVI
jgi:hypothetical protein